MLQRYYTYRVLIANRNTVRGEKFAPNLQSLGATVGELDYKGQTQERILELCQAARAGEALERELGVKLFAALFDQALRRDFFDFYEKVRAEQALLRLELDIDERELPDIAALPWEFMHAPSEAGYGAVWLSTDPHIVFSRWRAHWTAPKPLDLAPTERLRIALAVAAPGGLGPVKYQKVWNALEEIAADAENKTELLELVNPASPWKIDAALEQNPHILHFIGHGRFVDEQNVETGQIALVAVTGQPEWKSAEDFSELLRRHRPGIVLLQACEGAALSTSKAFVGLASQVVEQGVPVVVAMQYKISNSTARKFALEFYRRLSRGEPVDKAVQEGRRQIALGAVGYSTRDFATPVLFMGIRDGRLFQRSVSDLGALAKDNNTIAGESAERLSSSSRQRKRMILEKRLADLMDDYDAAMNQQSRALSDVELNRLKREATALDSEIQQVEEELNSL